MHYGQVPGRIFGTSDNCSAGAVLARVVDESAWEKDWNSREI